MKLNDSKSLLCRAMCCPTVAVTPFIEKGSGHYLAHSAGRKQMQTVVDNRLFVVGLSELFRQEMKIYEVQVLLPLAEEACNALRLPPADVPIEGYYYESDALAKFFRLIRALQQKEIKDVSGFSDLKAFEKLRRVLCSPAMGRVENFDQLLPQTTSPFGESLRFLSDWSIDALSKQARKFVRQDDAGLLAVASATGDPMALCIARESSALLSCVEMAALETPDYAWHVSEDVSKVAHRFVSALAESTGILLPEPKASSARIYGQAAEGADLYGRCILVGQQIGNPYPYYHWYIDSNETGLVVKDFRSSAIWTTETLRRIPADRRPKSGAEVGAPEDLSQDKLDKTGGVYPSSRGWLARILNLVR